MRGVPTSPDDVTLDHRTAPNVVSVIVAPVSTVLTNWVFERKALVMVAFVKLAPVKLPPSQLSDVRFDAVRFASMKVLPPPHHE